MKKLILLLFFAILTIKSYSQIVFENGYFINESNQRVSCLIKNIDWDNNPKEFRYKISENDSLQIGQLQFIKEFGINDVSKYIRATVNMDEAANEMNKLTFDKDPVFQERTLFLKVLVEGKASLFMYKNGDITRFFYQVDNSSINQLVYKQYMVNDNQITQNNQFQKQLYVDLKCNGIPMSNVETVGYDKKDLMKLFLDYNSCSGSQYVVFESKKKKDLFNLTVKPGLDYKKMDAKNFVWDYYNTDFDGKVNFGFGIEAEFIFPFNKNKWSLIIEPNYRHYKSEKVRKVYVSMDGIMISKINYHEIKLPVGIRHTFFLGTKSKIYINASYNFNFTNNSKIQFTESDGYVLNSLELKPRNNLVFGCGYKYKSKYSIELQYQTNQDILSKYQSWQSNYKTITLALGYTLF